jgi:hypothetical protein
MSKLGSKEKRMNVLSSRPEYSGHKVVNSSTSKH